VPVPEIETDPNSGQTYGVLAAMLFTDNRERSTTSWHPTSSTTRLWGLAAHFVISDILRRMSSTT
jgi:hypothetical protein